MKVIELDTDEMTIIPVDKRRYSVVLMDETESQVIIQIEPKEREKRTDEG